MPNQYTSLAEKLFRHIKENGPVSLEEYMQLCLTDPDFGYYSHHNLIGSKGDFITSPEISQIFGELIGLWSAEMWNIMGQPEEIRLVELGPGTGTLMSDALRATIIIPEFTKRLKVHLLEKNETLRLLQKQKLEEYDVDISWHRDIKDLPAGNAIFIANEFFDAMPIKQYKYQNNGWYEQYITIAPPYSEGSSPDFKFCLQDQEAKTNIDEILTDLGVNELNLLESTENKTFEYRKTCREIIKEISKRSKKYLTSLLIIDYGHEQSALGNTLQAVKSHKFADTLSDPGLNDLTTHVDFNQLRNIAEKNGMNCFGPIPQGQFLLSLGLSQRLNQLLKNASPAQYNQVKTGAERLIMPDQMGLMFKVLIAISSNLPNPPPY